ncbi:MAG: M90 family metallopeptidase [Sulfuriferula sp.]
MRRLLRHHPVPQPLWHSVTHKMAALQGLDAVQMAHLRELTTWFLHNKSINGVQGLAVTSAMRVTVAVQACLLILHLDTAYFDNWVEVILYPGAFKVQHEQTDATGLVHHDASTLTGEAWLRGPVILSWPDVERDSYHPHPGHNVVLHEFAHKLDGVDGAMNGLPPLRRGMSRQRWAADMSDAYAALHRQLETAQPATINPYAATSPAEFFAVLTEYFFTAPETLQAACPDAYQQLLLFYR